MSYKKTTVQKELSKTSYETRSGSTQVLAAVETFSTASTIGELVDGEIKVLTPEEATHFDVYTSLNPHDLLNSLVNISSYSWIGLPDSLFKDMVGKLEKGEKVKVPEGEPDFAFFYDLQAGTKTSGRLLSTKGFYVDVGRVPLKSTGSFKIKPSRGDPYDIHTHRVDMPGRVRIGIADLEEASECNFGFQPQSLIRFYANDIRVLDDLKPLSQMLQSDENGASDIGRQDLIVLNATHTLGYFAMRNRYGQTKRYCVHFEDAPKGKNFS